MWQFRPTFWLFLGIVLCGCVLRFWNASNLQIEHFDEGVYASNLFFGPENNYQYPLRDFYAPPLLPWLIEWSMILTGSANWSPFLPGLLFGCATVPLVGLFACRWFGPSTGLLTTLLAAGSDLHLMYSRTALTEPVLLFFLTAAVCCGVEALGSAFVQIPETERSNSSGWIGSGVCAGLLTGLAWSTKYSGWLPAAILSTSVVLLCLLPTYRTRWKPALRCVLFISCLGYLVFLPTLQGLQDVGGYAAISENHAQYVTGWSNWFSTAWRQLHNAAELESLTGITVLIVWCAYRLLTRPIRVVNSLGVILICLPVLFNYLVIHLILALVGYCAVVFHSVRNQKENHKTPLPTVACVACFVWLGAMTLMTPTYTPYPRLLVVLLPPVWIGMALFLETVLFAEHNVLQKTQKRIIQQSSAQLIHVVCVLLVLCLALNSAHQRFDQLMMFVPLQVRDSYAKLSTQLIQSMNESSAAGERIVYVYGEPALFFHLATAGEVAGPVTGLEFRNSRSPVPVYFCFGPHAEKADAQLNWRDLQKDFQSILHRDYIPSAIVQLNQSDPALETQMMVHLYRLNAQ